MSGGWSGGVFSISADMSANELAGIPILSRPFSDQRDEIVAGINNCLTKDGQNAPSADLPMGARKHTNVAPAVAVTNYVRAGEYIADTPRFMVDKNASSTVSVSCSALYWLASAVPGMTARIQMAATKPQTSAAEIEVVINGLTVSACGPDGQPIPPGALVSGGIYDFCYDGSKFRVLNPTVAVKTYVAVLKAYTAAAAPVTISTGATLTMLAGVQGDMAFINVKKAGTHAMTFQAGTAVYLKWESLPSHLNSVFGSGNTKVGLQTSAATDAGLTAFVAAGELLMQNLSDPTGVPFGDAATLTPFSMSYARNRTLT